MAPWLYYTLAALLLVSNSCGLLMNIAALPGNWLIVAGTALFCWLAHAGDGLHVSWYVIALLVVLAILGEVTEFLAGTATAARSGASRRAMILSVVGSIIGSVVGAVFGLPIPILGSAIAAMLGGALGAAGGAALGERMIGRELDGTIRVGFAAFWGRFLGTGGKIVIGAIMTVIATMDSIW